MNNRAGNGRSGMPDWLAGVILIEAVCLVIALLMPVTPNRFGTHWNPATLFHLQPTYIGNAIAWFLIGNMVVVLLGLVFWLVIRHRPAG